MMTALASLRAGSSCIEGFTLDPLRSTPFVASLAAQFAAQLNNQSQHLDKERVRNEVYLQGSLISERCANIHGQERDLNDLGLG